MKKTNQNQSSKLADDTSTERTHHEQHAASSEEHEVRVQKVKDMRKQGFNPWPQSKPVNATCHEVITEFDDAKESRFYEVAGRIVSSRGHGKTAFLHVQDRTGKLQIYIKEDIVGAEQFDFFKHMVDVGDFLWVAGKSFKTKMGEVTLKVEQFALISKCLHPLPEKFHGLADIEIKYRQRYLDLISSSESRERFQKRSKIIRIMRDFFDSHGFIEVETPMLHPIAGGAAAHPFVTHHNALSTDLYLRIAPELYLKRLVVGGFERVYEINRNFRNEGISTRHNPEFTMVEFYAAYLDYNYMMDFVEQMLKNIAIQVCGDPKVLYGDKEIDFGAPFERISMHDSIIKYGGCTASDLTPENIDKTLKAHKIVLDNKSAEWGHKLNALFEELVESKLIQPTFITEFPVAISPLAKRNSERPEITDRFELFVAGMELGNGFNELNDPFDQAERFKQQVDAKEGGDAEAHAYDAEYITALEYGLPPTVGVGIGIDRLTMLLTGTTSIKDVILFPTLKRKV